MKQGSVMQAAAHAQLALPVTLRLVNRVHDHIQARICRVNPGFFLISAPIPLKPEQPLGVVIEDRLIQSQVVYCYPQPGAGYQLGVRMTYDAGRLLRMEPRIPIDMRAELTVAGMEVPIVAKLVNISASGMGSNVDQPVPSDEIAYVKLDIGFAFGEIRHCSKADSGYRVGLKLDEFIAREHEVPVARRRSAIEEKPSILARLFARKNPSRF